jgi:hypothetical protein
VTFPQYFIAVYLVIRAIGITARLARDNDWGSRPGLMTFTCVCTAAFHGAIVWALVAGGFFEVQP